MELLDGKKVKLEILENLKEELKKLERKLGLVVIQIGEDPASCVYVNQKQKMAEKVGYDFYHIKLDEDVSEKEVLDLHQKTSEGMLTAKLAGKQIGQKTGAKLTTKKSKKAKEQILKYCKDFDGSLTDVECIKLIGISRNTYYTYKKDLKINII